MRLCYARRGGAPFIGLSYGEAWLDVSAAIRRGPAPLAWAEACPAPTIVDLLEHESDVVAALSRLVSGLEGTGQVEQYLVQGDVELLAPITRPSKIVCLGRNYLLHATQDSTYGVPDEPIIFAKAPSSIVGPGAGVVYHEGVERLDYEIELAAVIGKRAWHVAEADALSYVAGYTIVNDVTDRAMQNRDVEKHNPWFRSKSLDTYCPLGPALVLHDEVADPHQLDLTLKVNGQVRQHSNTSRLIFNLRTIIAFITRYITLEPGDIIATGTPEGIGPVQVGDVMECTVQGLGTLVNPVVAPGTEGGQP